MMSYAQESVSLKRDVQAVRIPSGEVTTLFAGTELMIVQSMGGTFTVMNLQGIMASVSGKDADALGKEIPQEIKKFEEWRQGKTIEEQVWHQLRTCYDPEIPHNIVDLGLVYSCELFDLPDGGKRVEIRMTLTAPGCGMGDWIAQDAKNKILMIPEIKEANVQVVFDPPWDRTKMSPALRREFYY